MSSSQGNEILFNRIREYAKNCEFSYQPKFIGFLDESQLFVVSEFIRVNKLSCCFDYGGYDEAERRVIGFFGSQIIDTYSVYQTDPQKQLNTLFPINTLRFKTSGYISDRSIGHRDVLGTLMSLGIKRETVGDIIVNNNEVYVIVLSSASEYIIQNVDKIGGVGVTCEIIENDHIPSIENFEELGGTVSSLRLDCIIALLTNCSREQSSQLIEAEKVKVNYEIETNNSKSVGLDTISIRGFGKFKIYENWHLTKKNRVQIKYKKFI